jgi:hypothetical protein
MFKVAIVGLTMIGVSRWAAAGAPGHAGDGMDRLVVHVYGAAAAGPEIAIARATATRLLGDAGISVAWYECGSDTRPGCVESPDSLPVIVRLVSRSLLMPDALGYSVVDRSSGIGTLVTIFLDRVRSMAVRAGVDAGPLLGRAVAHELGHTLMGSTRHSSAGLMRERWYDRELRRDLPADWALTSGDAERMRQGLAARSKRPNGETAAARATLTPDS